MDRASDPPPLLTIRSTATGPATARLFPRDVFEALDNITPLKSNKRWTRKFTVAARKKSREEDAEEKRFITAVNQVLVQVPKDVKSSRVWAKLFHERMIAMQDLSAENALDHYRDIFQQWLELVPPSDENEINRKVALAFLAYASTHRHDPDNALVGMEPAESTLLVLREYREKLTATPELSAGELIVARVLTRFVFVRINKVNRNEVFVHTTPYENQHATVSPNDVYPFDPKMLAWLRSVRTMEKMVHSPADDFYAHLNSAIRGKSTAYLQDQGIDVQVMKKFSRNQASIVDLNSLKFQREQLIQLLANIENTDLMRKVQDDCAKQVNQFLNDLQPEKLFPPTRTRTIETLRSTPFGALAKVDIQKFIAVCDSAADLLTLERREVLNGNTKNQLTEWWLDLICEAVTKYLESMGYVPNAVPHNYIERAPADMNACRKNLHLLQSILENLSDPRHPVHDLIASLKAKINPKIDEYIDKVIFILTDHFHLDVLGLKFNLDTVKQLLTESDEPESTLECIGNLISDLEYLTEMKFLEDHPVTDGGLKLGKWDLLKKKKKKTIL